MGDVVLKPSQVLGYLFDAAPGSMRDKSAALGRAPSYAGALKSKTKDPRISTVAAVARLSGSLLVVEMPDGSRVIVAPSQKPSGT